MLIKKSSLYKLRLPGLIGVAGFALIAGIGLAGVKLPIAQADSINDTDFVFTVDTTKTQTGSSTDTQFTIPASGTVTTPFNYTVDCDNDGVHEVTGRTGTYTCQYATPGIKTIRIAGTFPRFKMNNVAGDSLKLISIDQWGDNPWETMADAFYGAVNMDVKATDTPNLSQVKSLHAMFYRNTSLKGESANWNWDTSNVEAMTYTFGYADQFNQPLGQWNVSKVTSSGSMFLYASSFNQPLTQWSTSSLTNTDSMFFRAAAFNQSLASFDMSKVTTAASMLNNSGLSIANYDATLIGWNNQDLVHSVPLGSAGLKYCTAESARSNMMAAVGDGGDAWRITGDSKDCSNFPPTSLSLTTTNGAMEVADKSPAGTEIGTLSATSNIPNDTFTYSLTCNPAGAQDAMVEIQGDKLVLTGAVDYQTHPVLNICVRVTNSAGLTFDQVFAINVVRVLSPVENKDNVSGVAAAQEARLGDTGMSLILAAGAGIAALAGGAWLALKNRRKRK